MSTISNDGGVMDRVEALDGIRGLAVLFVLLYHSAAAVLGGFLLQSGVDLFFVLSGFLITTILVKTKDRQGYFRLFYARRAVRIFPLYYGVLAAMLVGAAVAIRFGVHADLGYPEAQNLIDNQAWGWLYQVNNLIAVNGPNAFPAMSHLWSLSVEEQFYLAWPLVVFLVPRRHLFAVCVGLAAFSFLFRSITYVVIGRDFAYHFTLCRLDGLAIGAAGAVVLATPALHDRFRGWVDWFARRWWIVLVLLVMPEPVALLPGFTVLSLAYLGLVLSAKEGLLEGFPRRCIHSRFLAELGKYSYGLYIFQFPITRAVLPITPTGIVLVDTVFHVTVIGGGAYVLSRVSWVVWERPWLRLKSRFAYG